MNEYGAVMQSYCQGSETELHVYNPVPLPFCPSQTPRRLAWDLNPGLHGERPATYHLIHGMNRTKYVRSDGFTEGKIYWGGWDVTSCSLVNWQ